jgi:hypothetical protein
MLPIHLVHEVQRLLDEREISRREIARRLGLARGTVQAIAQGRRGLYGREADADQRPASPERCPGCGKLVQMPCVYCRAVTYRYRLLHGECGGIPRDRAA